MKVRTSVQSWRLFGSRRALALWMSAGLIALLLPVLATGPSGSVARAADPIVSTDEQCLDADGKPIGCQFDIAPVELDSGITLGEYETASMVRSNSSYVPSFSVGDFAMADQKGSCSPSNGVCDSISSNFRVGSQVEAPRETGVFDGAYQAAPMDVSMTQFDFTGDGLSDVVLAAKCPLGGTSEICLSMFDPSKVTDGSASGYSPWYPTGLYADTVGFGRIRLSAGLINESRTSVVKATYSVPDDGVGMNATFTTSAPNTYRPGQLVRFVDASSLAEGLCVQSDSGDQLCLTNLTDQYVPVESVDRAAQTFTLRLGRMVDADPTAPEAVVPATWTADGAPASAVAVSPGLAMGWAAPRQSLRLASFLVNPDRRGTFSLLDTLAVGRLDGTLDAGRAPFDLVTDDFDGRGVSEIAMTWAATAGDAACDGDTTVGTCNALAFFRTNNGKQFIEVSRQGYASSSAATSLSLSSGTLVVDPDSNALGADLVVGMTLGTDQQLAVLDVGQDFEVTRQAWQSTWSANAATIARSNVRVVADDLDLDGIDEIVMASTRLNTTPTASTVTAPINVSIWRQDGASWVVSDQWNSPASISAYGAFGSGQVELAVGAIGRPPQDSGETYPNSLNPDVVLSWPCLNGCGSAGTGPAVATLPFAVTASGGTPKLTKSTQQQPIVRGAGALPTSATGVARETEPSFASFTLADLNADSETLGYPTTYVKVNEIRPVLVLRSPPTQLDAFDNVTPERGINYYEVQDINGCVLPGDCDGTAVKYTSDSTVQSRVSATVTNDWGVSAFLKVGGGSGQTDIEGYVKASVDYAGQNVAENTAGKSFSYSSEVTLGAGSSAAYAATQSTRVSEFPVFSGVSPWSPDLEPTRTVIMLNPANTEFSWIDLDDQDLQFSSSAPSPRNLLSYAPGRDDVNASFILPTKVERDSDSKITVTTESHNFACDVAQWTNLSTQYLTKFPCSGADMARVDLVGSPFKGAYQLTKINSGTELELTRAPGAGNVPSDASSTFQCNGTCKLIRRPGLLDEQKTVSKSLSAGGSFATQTQSDFQGSAAWELGGSLEGYLRYGGDVGIPVPGVGFEYAPAPLVELGLVGRYSRTEASSMAVAATVGTRFEYSIGALPVTKTAYKVQPFLTEDPATGAMTLDWSAQCASCDSAFWRQYSGRPDLALALPDLLDPYLSPQGIPNIQGVDLLRSPALSTWQCDAGLCRPPADLKASAPTLLTARVSNYSLRAYQSNRPVVVRWFAGDPRLGGYQIAQANVPTADKRLASVKAECGAATYCIPGQHTVAAWAKWTPPPGLAGAGTALRQFPIYAVIDPMNAVAEIHDWREPVNLQDCYDTYPYLLPPAFNKYDIPESLCPTTNNEGYYLPGFSGQNSAAADLYIPRDGLSVSRDGSTVTVDVGARSRAARAEVRIWACRPSSNCAPFQADKPRATKIVTDMPSRGTQAVKITAKLGTGKWTIWAQIVPFSNYELPGGGPTGKAGNLRDNVSKVAATVG